MDTEKFSFDVSKTNAPRRRHIRFWITVRAAIDIFNVQTEARYYWTKSTLNHVVFESHGAQIVTSAEETKIGPIPITPGTSV